MPSRPKLAIFTICSNNYMPMARVFAASARKHHPDADLFVCLADRIVCMDGLYANAGEIVPMEDLDIPDLPGFAFRYDIMELNTAVKPFMILHLLEDRHYEQVLYFDPDIEIFHPVEAVLKELEKGAAFVLTPHILQPSEGLAEPNDLSMLRAGTYNLGFIATRNTKEALDALHWWARRLTYQCINDQASGLFVDQKFIDLLPGFVSDVAVLRNSALNVAYWNLTQRELNHANDRWTVDGQPLIFFHYSGFDPRHTARLSKHTTLFDGKLDLPLASLLTGYATRLIAHGFGKVPRATYAFGSFASGTPIPGVVRRMFRDWHPAWPSNPFETFEAHLHSPWPGASVHASTLVVTNFLAYLHATSPYLRSCIDIKSAQGQALLIDWFIKHAGRELTLDDRLVQPVSIRFGDRPTAPGHKVSADRSRTDVSVIGYLRTTSGVGEIGRSNLASLSDTGLKVDGYDVSLGVASDRSDDSAARFLTERPAGRVRLFNINADQLPMVMQHMHPLLRDDAYTIANPAWELSKFPDAWMPAFDKVDEIWAISRYIQQMLAIRVAKPVQYIPVPLTAPAVAPLQRRHFLLPDGKFLFFFAFDFLSFIERKNPAGVIAAYQRAFGRPGKSASRPGLVVKALNGALRPQAMQALRDSIGEDPDIFLLESTLKRPEVAALVSLCDAIVSLHRAEGFGLLIAEAMLLGRPVIATDYSATTEMLSPSTGFPVDYRLIPVADGAYPFAEGQVWADPDLDHASWLFARLAADPGSAAARIAAARTHMEHTYSPRRVAQRQLARLRELDLAH